ncbi:MAG: hypothetical protein OEV21_00415 [Thermoplasmata archaeon]|nr:hypothetical protein [Thermoplasmata archaeon]
MTSKISSLLDNARSLADVFEVVKTAVYSTIHMSRGGLMLGLADLGNHPGRFFGAFYPVGTNIIVMNRTPLARIKETQPDLWRPYAFHVLLHEYLHTLGYLDENQVGRKVYDISETALGKDHPATQIAMDTVKFFPNLVYPNIAWQPENLDVELVEGFDRSSVSYIS